jgi:hypothetical protein
LGSIWSGVAGVPACVVLIGTSVDWIDRKSDR